ncbi:MAG: sigma factor [Polyangiaceae bacterium]
MTTHAPSDEELLDAFKRGDPVAIGALLERYEPVVYRFGLRMCRDPEEAKDVLQDTLLAAARGARGYRGGAALSTWLYTIARRTCAKRRHGLRAEAPTGSLSLDEDEARGVPSSARARTTRRPIGRSRPCSTARSRPSSPRSVRSSSSATSRASTPPRSPRSSTSPSTP